MQLQACLEDHPLHAYLLVYESVLVLLDVIILNSLSTINFSFFQERTVQITSRYKLLSG